ncbi:MAG: hypothetical protein AAFZ01_09660 [Pseudomonadota bacterium]
MTRSTTTFLAFALAIGLAATSFAPAEAHHSTKKKRASATHVSAPYTKVDVDDKVRVKAPYTRVKVGKGRVKVRAPFVNLDIKW